MERGCPSTELLFLRITRLTGSQAVRVNVAFSVWGKRAWAGAGRRMKSANAVFSASMTVCYDPEALRQELVEKGKETTWPQMNTDQRR